MCTGCMAFMVDIGDIVERVIESKNFNNFMIVDWMILG